MTEFVVEMVHVSRIYRVGDTEITALANVDLAVRRGEFVVVMGPSDPGNRRCSTFWAASTGRAKESAESPARTQPSLMAPRWPICAIAGSAFASSPTTFCRG